MSKQSEDKSNRIILIMTIVLILSVTVSMCTSNHPSQKDIMPKIFFQHTR